MADIDLRYESADRWLSAIVGSDPSDDEMGVALAAAYLVVTGRRVTPGALSLLSGWSEGEVALIVFHLIERGLWGGPGPSPLDRDPEGPNRGKEAS